MHRTLAAHGYPADLEARLRDLPATIAAPAAARLGDAADVDGLATEARLAGDDDTGARLYATAERLALSAEVHAALDALDEDGTWPCGCSDYHYADCPTRVA